MSSQSPLSLVSVCGENCARSLAPQGHFRTHSVGLGAPPLPTVRGAAGPLIGLAKRETGRARSKEKGAWMRSGAVALRADGGRRIGACSDLALPSGTLGPSAIPPTAVPWRMVRRSSGWLSHCLCFSFRCRWPVVDESLRSGPMRASASTNARAARSEAERAERESRQMRPCTPIFVGTAPRESVFKSAPYSAAPVGKPSQTRRHHLTPTPVQQLCTHV